MKIKGLLTFLFLTICTILQGQTLTSFTKNNLYGVLDAKQKVLIEPLFTEIKIETQFGLVAGKQNGLWQFFNFSGKELIRSPFPFYRINSINGTYVGTTYVPFSHLIEIREKFDGPRYILNPYAPDSEPKFWQPAVSLKAEKGWRHNMPVVEPGILKIIREDGKINFLDTSGNILSPVWFAQGYMVARNFMAIDTGSGQMALYDKNFKQRSEFLYSNIVGSFNPDYFLADDRSKNRSPVYWLIDTMGRKVFESTAPILAIDEDFIIINNVKSGMYTYEGKQIFEFENSSLEYFGADRSKFKIVQDDKTGIVDRTGKIILEPAYKNIHTTPGKYYIATKKNGSGLLDENFNEIFFMDSIQFSLADEIPGYFYASKRVHQRDRHGLIDSLGTIVIPFDCEVIYFQKRYQLIIAIKDSIQGAFDRHLEQVLPFRKGNFVFNPNLPEYYFLSADSAWVYTLDGKLFMQFSNINPHITPANYYEFMPSLMGREGEVIFQNEYEQLFSNGITGPAKMIIIGRSKNPSGLNDVFNNERKLILPEGYGLLERNTNGHTGTNGMIIVHNIQDVLQKKEIPKAGVIDLQGQWVVKPGVQYIRENDKYQIETMDPVTKETKLIPSRQN